ncbi:transposase [Phytohabitans kaempferiae]|uniref:Transposase n=1 Tax=Phytohabitans kaempferiae TaxID=1620943 RepID=A0ABV6M6V7_9ACTN
MDRAGLLSQHPQAVVRRRIQRTPGHLGKTTLGLTIDIVRKLAGQVGFQVLPRRWVAERTFAWINRCRRTVRDYEKLPAHHAAMVQWAMVIVMTKRLARLQARHQHLAPRRA